MSAPAIIRKFLAIVMLCAATGLVGGCWASAGQFAAVEAAKAAGRPGVSGNPERDACNAREGYRWESTGFLKWNCVWVGDKK